MPDAQMQMGKESTIKGYIGSYRVDDMTLNDFFFQQVYEDIKGRKMIVNRESLLVRYMSELKTVKEKHTLTNAEYRKYRFNPKLLSFDLYGTTELWALILDINELTSAAQFDLREVYLFPGYIVDRLERMLNLEKDNKDYNAEEVSSALNA